MADSPRSDDESVSDASENAPSMAEADPSDGGNEYSDQSDDSIGLLSISETQDLCNIHYSREATIAAFKDYYEFLASMYMDPEVIERPPEGGWPQLTVESMQPLGKTDEVVELLRRLPYTRQDSSASVPQVGGWFTLYNWAQSASHIYPEACQGVRSHVPSHVVGLSTTEDAEMFLDTHLGVIYFPGGVCTPGPTVVAEVGVGPFPPISDDPLLYFPEEECEWRSVNGGPCAWAITDFFEMLKHHFRELNYIPTSREEVAEAFHRNTSEEEDGLEAVFPTLRSIFTAHGWPDLAHYKKDACMDAVELVYREHRERIYPEHAVPGLERAPKHTDSPSIAMTRR